jgi:hypothetical protein
MSALDEPKVLSAWKPDLGDTENERQSQAQKFAAQMHNSLVIIQKAASGNNPTTQQQKQQQEQ